LAKWAGSLVPETKEGSYQTANRWWEAKQAEIDGGPPAPHPNQADVDEITSRRDWCRKNGDEHGASFYDGLLTVVLDDRTERPSHFYALRQFQALNALLNAGITPDHNKPIPENLVGLVNGDHFWDERLRGDAPSVPDDQTVGGMVSQYLELRRMKVETGRLSPKGFDNSRDCLHHFRDHVGPQIAVAAIDEAAWHRFHGFTVAKVRDKVWSRDFASKVFGTARQFVAWAASMGALTTPKNLDNRDYRLGKTVAEIPTTTIADVRRLIDGTSGQLKLHLLLMINCGFTQVDVSDLHPSEVDWTAGRIRRKRSKTRDEPNAPVVDFAIWPETFELLREHRSDDPDHVLVTRSGSRWVYHELHDGKLKSSDSIATNYNRLRRRVGGGIGPLKLLRKTSASLLGEHPEFRAYAQYFLGHAPQTLADCHYVKPSTPEFDRALAWLRGRYGFVD